MGHVRRFAPDRLSHERFVSERRFLVLEYTPSLGQLLLRGPDGKTNLDLHFWGVEYMALANVFPGIELAPATSEELASLTHLLRRPADRPVRREEVFVLLSEGRRFPIVSHKVEIRENGWDFFQSPVEFRTRYRYGEDAGSVRLVDLVRFFRSGGTFEEFCAAHGLPSESEAIEIYAHEPVSLESPLGFFPIEETEGRFVYGREGKTYRNLFDFFHFQDSVVEARIPREPNDEEIARILLSYALKDA